MHYFAFDAAMADERWPALIAATAEAWSGREFDLASEVAEMLDGDARMSRPTMLHALADADLRIGSIAEPVYLEEPKWHWAIVGFLFMKLAPAYSGMLESGTLYEDPTTAHVDLFTGLTKRKVIDAVLSLTDAEIADFGGGADRNEFGEIVFGFLYEIREVVKACADKKLRIVITVNGEICDPYLAERARRHLDELCARWPSLASRLTDAA